MNNKLKLVALSRECEPLHHPEPREQRMKASAFCRAKQFIELFCKKEVNANEICEGAQKQREGTVAAFTLAEVLITLAIIGVVAALTIPTLLHKYEMMVTTIKLRKFYSTISQTIVRAEAEHGSWQSWNWKAGPTFVFDTYFKNYLSVTKIKDYGTGVIYRFNDGSCMSLTVNSFNALNNDIGKYYVNYTLRNNCLFRGPGRTAFKIGMYNFKDPWKGCHIGWCGWDYQNRNLKWESTCRAGSAGWTTYECTMKFIQDGFKFKEDYPFFEMPLDASS